MQTTRASSIRPLTTRLAIAEEPGAFIGSTPAAEAITEASTNGSPKRRIASTFRTPLLCVHTRTRDFMDAIVKPRARKAIFRHYLQGPAHGGRSGLHPEILLSGNGLGIRVCIKSLRRWGPADGFTNVAQLTRIVENVRLRLAALSVFRVRC